MGFFDFLTGGKSRVEGIALPKFEEDPIFKDLQEYLSGYGKNLLEGKPNEYYKGIGEAGGSEFENMLALSNRDIQQSVLESAAKGGRGRGGAVASVTAQQVADNTTKLRFADFLRAMQGKEFLFGQGRGITEASRESGLANQGQKNNFNLANFDNAMAKAGYLDEYDNQKSQGIGKMVGTVAGGALGFMAGGPAGALAGAGIGGGMFGGGDGGGGFDLLDMLESSKKPSLKGSQYDFDELPGVSKYGSIKGSMDSGQFPWAF